MGGSSTQMVFHTGTDKGKPLHPDHFWWVPIVLNILLLEASFDLCADYEWLFVIRSHSWLSFGSDKVQERVWELILINHQTKNAADAALGIVSLGDDNVVNPCLFKGYSGEYVYTGPVVDGTVGAKLPQDKSPLVVNMVGTGQSIVCRNLVREVLWPDGCVEGGPCPLDNVEHPPVDGLFFGMVWSTMHKIKQLIWYPVVCLFLRFGLYAASR